MPDKVGYEKAVNKLMEDCQIDMSIEGDNLIDFKTRLEALAIAEGERRQKEKEKSWFAGFGNIGIEEYERIIKNYGRQQALKEVEKEVIRARNLSVLKTQMTGYETAELIGFDKAIGILKQAIEKM